MNKKLLDNYDKMVVKDKVAVIHCAFGDTPHTVAFVHAVSYTHLTLPTSDLV